MSVWSLDEFRACRSPWQKLLRFACKRGFVPAKRHVTRKLTEALEYDAMSRVMGECVRTGRTVRAHRDENGSLVFDP